MSGSGKRPVSFVETVQYPKNTDAPKFVTSYISPINVRSSTIKITVEKRMGSMFSWWG